MEFPIYTQPLDNDDYQIQMYDLCNTNYDDDNDDNQD